MSRRARGGGSRGGSEGRVRGRVRERVQGRGGRRRGSSFDVGDIGKYTDRLAGHGGGASAFAGAASGLAGGGLASRFLGSKAEGSEEDFRNEILEQLALMDERLQRLEEEMYALLGGETEGNPGGLTEPGDAKDPAGNP